MQETKFPITQYIQNNYNYYGLWTDAGLLTDYYTPTNINTNLSNYFISIYDKPNYYIQNNLQFDMAFASINNSGSNSDLYKQTLANYKYYAGLLLESASNSSSSYLYNYFRTNLQPGAPSLTISDAVIFNLNRLRCKDGIETGSLQFNFVSIWSGSSGYITSSISLTDYTNSMVYHNRDIESYKLVQGYMTYESGSVIKHYQSKYGAYDPSIPANETYTNNLGVVYPKYGIIVLDYNNLSSSLSDGIDLTTYSPVNCMLPNISTNESSSVEILTSFYTLLKGDKSITELNDASTNLIGRSYKKDMIYYYPIQINKSGAAPLQSSNPTFNSSINTVNYITTIGLYNDDNQLLAVVKPRFAIKYDYSDPLPININIKLVT